MNWCVRWEEARQNYDGKNVVIVGCSNSACEIAAELANVCAQVMYNSRMSEWVCMYGLTSHSAHNNLGHFRFRDSEIPIQIQIYLHRSPEAKNHKK